VCAQGVLNHFLFPTCVVLTGAEGLLNHPVYKYGCVGGSLICAQYSVLKHNGTYKIEIHDDDNNNQQQQQQHGVENGHLDSGNSIIICPIYG
jgi:hypothetical protein